MPLRYRQYAGSPDVFEADTGRYISEDEAKQKGIFGSGEIEQAATPRPGVKKESDFALLRGQNLTPQETGKVIRYERTESPLDIAQKQYYESLPKTLPNETAIKEQTRREMQTYIDAINESYDRILGEERGRGQERMAQTRAIASRSGVLGSDFGASYLEGTRQKNAEVERAIESERAIKIQAVLQKVDDRAMALIEKQKTEALGNTERYLQYLSGEQEQAKGDAKQLAEAGVSLDQLQEEDYKKLLDQTGMNNIVFKAFYNASLPKSKQRDYHYEKVGDTLVAFSVNPMTGKLERESFEFPEMKADDEFKVLDDGTPLLISKQGGAVTNIRIPEGFKQGQFAKPRAPNEPPSSYQEWTLAGKPGTYADWLLNKKDGTQETEGDKKRAIISEMGQMLGALSRNGVVTPERWSQLRSAWVQEGGNAYEFDQNFSQYIDQTNKDKYFRERYPYNPLIPQF